MRPAPLKNLILLLLLGSCLFLTVGLFGAEQRIHKVQPDETLFALALQYGLTVESIMEANSLNRDMIRTGQELIIPSVHQDTWTVRPGDTLSGIALQTGIPMKKLISLNRLSGTELNAGTSLELVRPPQNGETHRVEPGDTLSWISLKYDLSVERLRQLNDLPGDTLKAGRELALTSDRPQTIEVQPGDSLWKLSSRYGVAVDDLISWNGLSTDVLAAGRSLQLYPLVLEEYNREEPPVSGQERKSDPPDTAKPEPAVLLAAAQPPASLYFSRPAKKRTQPSRIYSEEDLDSPWANYKKASALLEEFDRAVESLPTLGKTLDGYRIMLDPGHGGLDPGAIVESRDGLGNRVYAVEDEYCYDIAMRVYKDLKRYGADVGLTVISPNQTIRRTPDASLTFVNEKNEVYNSSSVNRKDLDSSWPVGNRAGLEHRVRIAGEFFSGAPREKCIYISIHADNNPGSPEGTAVLYHPEAEGTASNALAEHYTEYLGLDSYARPQTLRVLDGNPAGAAVLIEIRNLAYPNNSWAIRNESLRQDDADRIVNGLLSYSTALRR